MYVTIVTRMVVHRAGNSGDVSSAVERLPYVEKDGGSSPSHPIEPETGLINYTEYGQCESREAALDRLKPLADGTRFPWPCLCPELTSPYHCFAVPWCSRQSRGSVLSDLRGLLAMHNHRSKISECIKFHESIGSTNRNCSYQGNVVRTLPLTLCDHSQHNTLSRRRFESSRDYAPARRVTSRATSTPPPNPYPLISTVLCHWDSHTEM